MYFIHIPAVKDGLEILNGFPSRFFYVCWSYLIDGGQVALQKVFFLI